jgi:hypothetical protein
VTLEGRRAHYRRQLAWALWGLAMLGLAAVVWLDLLLRQTGRPELSILAARWMPTTIVLASICLGFVLLLARLRRQVDLDALTGELLTVVEQTVQPTSVSLWLWPR